MRRALTLSLGLLLAVPALPAVEGPAPMSYHGSAAAEAIHALTMIAAGDAEAVAALPAATWHSAVAIPDHEDADLALRWSRCIGASLARCPPERQPRILALIDQACQADLAAHPQEPWRAADYLPAPSALTTVNRLSARAFDHGCFLDSLRAGAELPQEALSPLARTRLAAARELSGLGEDIAAGEALQPPGEPQPVPMVRASRAAGDSTDADADADLGGQGLTVRWVRTPAYLLAMAGPEVRWQYRVETDAETVAGPGGVLVRDGDGMRWLDEQGHATTLASPPGMTRMLAIAGGAAWFATGDRAWRLPLAGGAPAQLELGAAPLAPPLVRGGRSLWLLPDQLRLFAGGQELARIRHHLAVSASWRLERDPGGMAALIAPDGGRWRIAPLAEALAQAPVLERARLLVAAQRGAEAVQLLAGAPEAATAAGRAALFAAHCSLGAAHVAAQSEAIAALAPDPAALIAVHYAAWRLAGPAEAAGRRAALLEALDAAPGAAISWSIEDLDREPGAWAHLSTAAVMREALEVDPPGLHPLTISKTSPLIGPVPCDGTPAPPPVDELVDDPQLGRVHRYAGRLIRLSHSAGISELDCHGTADHALAWRQRWPSDPQQPSRALALLDDTVVVAEGTSELVLVDLRSGSIRGRVDCGDLPADPSRCCIAGSVIAIPGQLNRDLELATGLPSSVLAAPGTLIGHLVHLPADARWLAPVPPLNQVLVRLEDGQAQLYPGADAVELPAAVLASAAAPVPWGRGLELASSGTGDLYSWNVTN